MWAAHSKKKNNNSYLYTAPITRESLWRWMWGESKGGEEWKRGSTEWGLQGRHYCPEENWVFPYWLSVGEGWVGEFSRNKTIYSNMYHFTNERMTFYIKNIMKFINSWHNYSHLEGLLNYIYTDTQIHPQRVWNNCIGSKQWPCLGHWYF